MLSPVLGILDALQVLRYLDASPVESKEVP